METAEKKKVVVIGGGIAGLSAGIYALLSGFEAEIYEKNSVPGGECIGWNRKGFHIDNCIHWLTGTKKGTELYEVWKKIGALNDDTEYAPVDSFFTACCGEKKATLWNDLRRTEKELIEAAPEDEEEIKKFIQHVEYSKQCVFPAGKPMEMWGMKDYIKMGMSMKDFPKVIKEFGKISLLEYSKRFKSPLMRHLICDYLPKEYTAYSFFVSYATMADGNGGIPMGASFQMSCRIEKRFKELGGKIFYNKSVSQIVLKDGTAEGLSLDDGTFVQGDYIIPAVDTKLLFEKLLPQKYMPKEYKRAYAEPKKYPAMSGFHIAYTAPKDFKTSGMTFLDIEPLRMGNKIFKRIYIKSYAYDPIFIKDGKQVIQAGFSQTDEDFDFWKALGQEEYNRTKKDFAAHIESQLEKIFPELKGGLEYLDSWTPLTYERYCNAYHGSYMSFTTTPGTKQLKSKGRIKGIKNLYLAGQWTNSPGGLPVAVSSGKFAVQRLLKKLHRDINI